MKRKLKNISIITIAILTIGLMPLAGGCTSTTVFIPEAVPLGAPPIKVTADQLYQDYMADEAAADAKYKDKELWII